MIVNYAYITNKGTHRDHNEDSILISDKLINNTSMDQAESGTSSHSFIFAVADGMGGLQKGEVASQKVLEFLWETYGEVKKEEDIKKMVDTIQYDMIELLKRHPEDFRMGTTLTGLKVTDKEVLVFNVGDSRTYRVLNGYLEKLTKDHSLVQRMVDAGIITEEEMALQPNKNIVTSAFIASNETIEEISSKSLEINERDRFLIVSDGVWEALTLDEMEGCLTRDLKESVDNIFSQAIKNKCKDNVSAILLEIKK